VTSLHIWDLVLNLIRGDSSEYLYLIGWDPKDGDLYVSRMKSEETLMEVRRDANVQIVLQTCV